MKLRDKLIFIFVITNILPLIVLALVAFFEVQNIGEQTKAKMGLVKVKSQENVAEITSRVMGKSIEAIEANATESIELTANNIAHQLAQFLYGRDNDIKFIAELPMEKELLQSFIKNKSREVVTHGKWQLTADGTNWEPSKISAKNINMVEPVLEENDSRFHYLPKEERGIKNNIPLYLEATFFDLKGIEKIKVSNSKLLTNKLQDVSLKENTFCKAEDYFDNIGQLKKGEVYVSDVIGEYVGSKIIGIYTPENAAAKNIAFEPEKAAYAGKENPAGKRFQGLVRWVTPVYENEVKVGYVSLALDHTHIMEFTDHSVPTSEHFTEISDPGSGNYAWMWDYKGRCISHPRDHSIFGYDAKTGQPAVPWLSAEIYDTWQKSGKSIGDFLETGPKFLAPSRSKKPSKELTQSGNVGLDGRYLNFAPQCLGWHNLTKDGGSGSFSILWSGLWKVTVAAAIPYHTGRYSGERGFGYITFGSNLGEFTKPVTELGDSIDASMVEFDEQISEIDTSTQNALESYIENTIYSMTKWTIIMSIVVIVIAVWLAIAMTNKIKSLIYGLERFSVGESDYRLTVTSKDEFGLLKEAFNDMAEKVSKSVKKLSITEAQYRHIFENAQDPMCQVTFNKFLTVNEEMALMLGFDSIDALFASKLVPLSIFPEKKNAIKIVKRLERMEKIRGEKIKISKQDGSIITAAVSIHQTIKNGEEAIYECIIRDISAREEFINALETARADAEEANLLKSDFLANMSHEIRTPMNAIIGMTHILGKSELGDAQQDNVAKINLAANSLLGIINSILDLSKIESGKLDLENIKFSLKNEVLDGLVQIMQPLAKEKELHLQLDVDPNLDQIVLGDPLRLSQVLTNLVSNAIKFTEEGKVVVLAKLMNEDSEQIKVNFTIEDTGIGLEEKKIDDIFSPFSQADTSTTRKFGGTGLGLSICKELVSCMGGNLCVRSELNSGTAFSFELIFEKVEADHLIVEQQVASISSNNVESSESKLSGLNVLVVEDNDINQDVVGFFLEDVNCKVEFADNGAIGVEKARSGKFDLVLMDIQMPVMDGITATKIIRNIDDQVIANIPIVAMTAHAMKEDMEKHLACGMNGQVTKPLNIETFYDAIAEFV